MGYFSNATENDLYQEQWCNRCIHRGPDDGPGCPIMGVHFLYNYEQYKRGNETIRDILQDLIPPEGVGNGQCKMFVQELK